VENALGLFAPRVAQAVPCAWQDKQRITLGKLARLAVQVDLERAADQVNELLRVRVIVLGDVLAGPELGETEESPGRPGRPRAEQDPDGTSSPDVSGH
jgi:hypothetical protein